MSRGRWPAPSSREGPVRDARENLARFMRNLSAFVEEDIGAARPDDDQERLAGCVHNGAFTAGPEG